MLLEEEEEERFRTDYSKAVSSLIVNSASELQHCGALQMSHYYYYCYF